MTDLEALDVRYRGRRPQGGEHAERCLALVQSAPVAKLRGDNGLEDSAARVRAWFGRLPHVAELRDDEREAALARFLGRVKRYGKIVHERRDTERALEDALADFQHRASAALAELAGLGGGAVPEAVRAMRERMPWVLQPSPKRKSRKRWGMAEALGSALELAHASPYELAHAACAVGLVRAAEVKSLETRIGRVRANAAAHKARGDRFIAEVLSTTRKGRGSPSNS